MDSKTQSLFHPDLWVLIRVFHHFWLLRPNFYFFVSVSFFFSGYVHFRYFYSSTKYCYVLHTDRFSAGGGMVVYQKRLTCCYFSIMLKSPAEIILSITCEIVD